MLLFQIIFKYVVFFVLWLWFLITSNCRLGPESQVRDALSAHTTVFSSVSCAESTGRSFCDKVNQAKAQVTTAAQQWEPIADHTPALDRAAASQWFMVMHFSAHSACYHESSDESSCSHLSVVAIS